MTVVVQLPTILVVAVMVLGYGSLYFSSLAADAAMECPLEIPVAMDADVILSGSSSFCAAAADSKKRQAEQAKSQAGLPSLATFVESGTHYDFLHLFPFSFHIRHQLQLGPAAVQIMIFPMNFEVSISLEIIC